MKIGSDKRIANDVAGKIKAKLVLGQLDIEKNDPAAPPCGHLAATGTCSIKITYDVYGHWVPGRFKSEVDDLDNPHQPAPKARLNESEF